MAAPLLWTTVALLGVGLLAPTARAACPHASRYAVVGANLPADHPALRDESQWCGRIQA